MTTVFIDGQAGTTGLEIVARLRERPEFELLELDDRDRKSPAARRDALAAADVAILCLPDDAAREAVALAPAGTRILDASSAHRTAPGWCYGVPELAPGQREAIASATRVANPGCYAQAYVLLVRPLVDAGVLEDGVVPDCHGLSGYSGGGRALIERFEAMDEATRERWTARPYALGLAHKHLPEMRNHSGVGDLPLFTPVVGAYYRGMLVSVPLRAEQLKLSGSSLPEALQALLRARYDDEPCLRVFPARPLDVTEDGFLDATACNHSNRIELMVFGHERQALLVARLDNLGKGAAGAAVQNLNLMTGTPELEGLAL